MKASLRSALTLGACLIGGCGSAWADSPAILTMADQPVRLIRAASAYKAVNGTVLQKDDMLETGAAGAHIEAGPDAIVAMGPQTKVYLVSLATNDKGATELALLQGWVKLHSKTARRAQVTTPVIQVSLAAGASIVHSVPGKDEMFADEGEQVAAVLDAKGKPGAPIKVAGEQYAFVGAAQALKVLPRPARDFLSEMPPAFRDRMVVAPGVKASKLPPVKEREVDYADVDAWLNANLALRKNFVSRFRLRLKDANFRKQLDQALGQSSEWKTILHPVVVPETEAPKPAPSPIY